MLHESLRKENYDKLFEKHVIMQHDVFRNIDGLAIVEILTFREPGHFTYALKYVLLPYNGILHVSGDCGFASYLIGSRGKMGVKFEDFASCHLQYFSGLCEASEMGRNYDFRLWEPEMAEKHVRDYLLNREIVIEEEDADKLMEIIRKRVKPTWDNANDWCEWLRCDSWKLNKIFQREEFEDVFEMLEDVDFDYYDEKTDNLDPCDWSEIGWVIHPRVALHLEGLKRALKRLEMK